MDVYVERKSWAWGSQYHVQFCLPPHGWFRACGRTPAKGLQKAWRLAMRQLPIQDRVLVKW